MPVDTRHHCYDAMAPKWKRLRDCFGGRDAVIAAGTEYLPALPGNPGSDYGQRGNFYNAVKRTVQGLVGAIAQKAPTVTLPARIEEYEDDITLSGISVEEFVRKAEEEVTKVGRYACLVEMSAGPEGTAVRPYLVAYRTEDVTGWREESRGGDPRVLVQVVLREEVEERDPKDPFAVVCVTQYRVCFLDDAGAYTQQLWRKKDGDSEEWVPFGPQIIPLRRGKPLLFIPLYPVGPTSMAIEPEDPPLTDLADVNLAHWRNSADHEYGLHLVALPTPWVAGQKGSDGGGPLKIGPSVVWELEKDGSAGMLEFSGSGLASIKDAMAAKEKQMATLGARLLEDQSGAAETATAVGMRHSGEHATLRSIAASVEQWATCALQTVTWWMGIEATPKDVGAGVELNKDYFTVKASPDEVRAAMALWQAEAITFATFYERLQTGGWTREGVSAEDERAEIEREAPPPPKEPPPEPDPNMPPDPNAPPMPGPVPPQLRR